ncbi:TetR/AcrR family transcriptional regulator [uncultured Tateyamaria sp.]|uniref:TetR/AcrR family transcriptional regulator n=1 Tax=uncultured Tateyamaria sp. TaxID=455651 RepID=UPI00260EBFC0|nr:TetR/AcrR family transcriptional regulator [uncultured Tateyamaria sp.]
MDTQTRLLDHAETLARTRGFDGFSFADLALSTEIRKASVHYHFPAKADLSLALIARYRGVFLEKLHGISQAEPTAGARVLAFLDLYRAASDGGRSLCLCVALSVTQRALPDAARAELAAFHRDVTAWLEPVFRLAQADGSLRHVTDPRAEASAAMAQVEGAQIMARAARDATRFEAAIQSLVARVI